MHCFYIPPEAMPGNIRKAEHFIGFMRRFNEYLKVVGWSGCEEITLNGRVFVM